MSLPVDSPQLLQPHVGVDLRRREARVAEQLLYDADVRSLVEKVRGKGVSERVRAEGPVPAELADAPLEHEAQPPRGKPAAPHVDEERCARRARGRCRRSLSPHSKVLFQRPDRRLPQKDHPLPPPLAYDPGGGELEVDVPQVEAHSLRSPASGGIEELEDGLVPRVPESSVGPRLGRGLPGRGVQESTHLLLEQERGQAAPAPPPAYPGHRVRLCASKAPPEAEVAAQGRGHPVDGRGGKPPPRQVREKGLDRRGAFAREGGTARKGLEQPQVPPVGRDRIAAEAAHARQVVEVPVNHRGASPWRQRRPR